MYFVVIYAFFFVNFILQKFCSCKRNDKYQVCLFILFMFRLEISWILFLEAPSFSHFSYFKPCIIQKQEQHLQKLASTIPVSWRKRKNVHHHLADCPAVFFRFACLHSWRWEPSLLCGTFKAVLQHQKSGSQTVFFVAKLEVYMMKAEEKAKKWWKPAKKCLFFPC